MAEVGGLQEFAATLVSDLRGLGLQARGYQVFMVLEQKAKARLATVRLRKAQGGGEPLIADPLFASSGIEVELVDAATEEDLPGIGAVPFASCGHLIALKLLSRRDE